MNDRVSDADIAALTHEEALQVLRLTPEGLRRLADLDEAIIELRAARSSLLANRLESIKDAFAAARNGQGHPSTDDGRAVDGASPATPVAAAAVEDGLAEVSGPAPEPPPASPPLVQNGRSHDVAARVGGRADAFADVESAGVLGEIRALRSEVAEIRRQVSEMSVRGSDAEIQQLHLRLSYLEAELESRHL